MTVLRSDRTLTISGARQLSAANSRWLRSQVGAVLDSDLVMIEVDLSETTVVDSCGLGALIWIFRTANRHSRSGGVVMRILDPPPPVRQLLELTRMHRLFEITHRAENSNPATE